MKKNSTKVKITIISGVVVFFALGALKVVAEQPSEIKNQNYKQEEFAELTISNDPYRPFSIDQSSILTFDDSNVYESPVIESEFEFNAVAPYFEVVKAPKLKTDDEHEESEAGHEIPGFSLRVQTSTDGENWLPYTELGLSDNPKPGDNPNKLFAEFPLFSEGKFARYQLIARSDDWRGVDIKNFSLNFMDTRISKVRKVARFIFGTNESSVAAASSGPAVISRAGWDSPDPNNTMFQGTSKYWPAEYENVSHFFVHHTAGSNDPDAGAETVRAIWNFHANTRGWGDIGYNFVVDWKGRIYEGRFGGDEVIGGHVLHYNDGSMGVAVLGNFTDTNPPSAARTSLADLFGFRASKYDINVLGKSELDGKLLNHISGHRNAQSTACPGDRLYGLLGSIRTAAADRAAFYSLTASAFDLNFSKISYSQTGTASLTITNNSPNDLVNKQIRVLATHLPTSGGYSFPTQTITLPQGQSMTLTYNRSWTETGTYSAWPAVYEGGKWVSIGTADGVPAKINFEIQDPSDMLVVTNFATAPTDPVQSEAVTANATIHNTSDLPYTTTSSGVAVRDPNDRAVNFDSHAGVTIPADGILTFAKTKSFEDLGTHTAWVYAYDSTGGYRISPKKTFVVSSLTEKLVASGLTLSPSNPAVGQSVNATFNLTNNTNSNLTLSHAGVAVRDTDGNAVNFPIQENVAINASASAPVSVTRSFGTPGKYYYWAYYYNQGNGYRASSTGAFEILPVFGKIKVTNFTITPASPSVGEEVTAKFDIKNEAGFPITFDSYGVAARDSDNAAFNFAPMTDQTLADNETKTIELKRVFGSIGEHDAWVYFYLDGAGYRASAVKSFTNRTYVGRLEFTGPSINPSAPVAGQDVSGSFGIKNVYSRTLNIDNAGIAVRDAEGVRFNFPSQQGLELAPGESVNVQTARTFGKGAHSYYGYFYAGGVGYRATPYKSFDVTENILKATNFTLNTSDFALGETLTGSITLKNEGGTPVNVSSAGIAVRNTSGNAFNFDPETNFVVNPGESKTLNLPKIIPAAGSFYAWGYYYAGTGYKVTSNKIFKGHLPKLSLTSGLNINPEYPLENENITASFTIKNQDTRPAVLDNLGVTLSYAGDLAQLDFEFAPKSLNPGESYSYSDTKTLDSSGAYEATVRYLLADDQWRAPGEVAGTATTKTFDVYETPADVRYNSTAYNPSTPVQFQETKATFTISNLGGQPIEIDRLGVAVRELSTNDAYNMSELTNVLIGGGETKSFDASGSFSKLGSHTSWVYMYENNVGTIIKNVNGAEQIKKEFTVVSIADKVTNPLRSTSPSLPKTTDLVTGKFSLTNTLSVPLKIKTAGIAVRLGGEVKNFDAINNIVLAANETKSFTQTKNFPEQGEYTCWVYFYDEAAGYRISENFYFQVVNNPKAVTVTATGDYKVTDKDGNNIDGKVLPGQITSVVYSSGKYYVNTPDISKVTTSYVRIRPIAGGVLRVTSFDDIPSWNTSLNDNEFRTTIEIRYSSNSNKVWVINELSLEHYLRGIAETSASSHSTHLKTMTVAARSYAYCHVEEPSVHCGKHPGEPFDLVNSRNGNGNDQQYKGYGLEKRFPELTEAVTATAGKVVAYNGTPVITPYYSRSDGRTRSAREVWGWTDTPWLVSVSDPDSDDDSLLGHGVGLAGDGASARASRGDSYSTILRYYYRGASIGTVSNTHVRVSIYGFKP